MWRQDVAQDVAEDVLGAAKDGSAKVLTVAQANHRHLPAAKPMPNTCVSSPTLPFNYNIDDTQRTGI